MLTSTLIGGDIPGTFVTLTIKTAIGKVKDVKLTRISSEAMSDKRRIFELINEAKNAAVRIRAPAIHKMMEEILAEWSEELREQHQHDELLAENLGTIHMHSSINSVYVHMRCVTDMCVACLQNSSKGREVPGDTARCSNGPH